MTLAWLQIDAHLARFEQARADDPAAPARDFLPPDDDPNWRAVLRELACVEMELDARAGRPPSLDDYRLRYPELFDLPEDADALLAQQRRLSDRAPDRPTVLVPARSWSEQASAAREQHVRGQADVATGLRGGLAAAGLVSRMLDRRPDAPRAAALAEGDVWQGFVLREELGRGAFGRVFLAEQVGLGGRQVALKIGEDLLHESSALARLQHTHVMPVHSVHREGPLVGVCMPFLGRTTLADVLLRLRRDGPPQAGNALLSTLRQRRTSRPGDGLPPVARPAADPLEPLCGLDQPHAVLWLAVRLADGLAHAHERGILHRDLKPANVLLSDEGQPLLLDFNLADDVRLRGGVPAVMGGTLPYMAPEHLMAFRDGAGPVDERSDVYGLGVMLYELLDGGPPFPTHPGGSDEQLPGMLADRLAGPPRRRMPNVTPAVAAILRRCLEPDPSRRYQSARQLQEDAQRHLDDLPLKHTPEPSWIERAGKWRRRNPRLAVALAAGLMLALSVYFAVGYARRSAEAARAEASVAARDAGDELRQASVLLSQPFLQPDEVEQGADLCSRALGRLGPPGRGGEHLPSLPDEQRPALRAMACELLLLSARAEAMRARLRAEGGLDRLELALDHNREAGRLAGDDQVRAVLTQRAALLRSLGRRDEADEAQAEARAVPTDSARDLYLLAGEKLEAGELAEARELLRKAIRRQPDRAAPWAALGACEAAVGRHDRAVSAYTTCLALRPELWWVRLWRGQSHLERKDHGAALEDFDDVVERRPDFAPALAQRALARLGKGDAKGAEADLGVALEARPDDVRAYFLRARAREARGDREGAESDRREGLRRTPTDAQGWATRGFARLASDPEGALADFDAALKLDPLCREAAQNKAHLLADRFGKDREALATLAPRLGRYPEDALMLAGRAVLLARLGRRAEAHRDAKAALDLDGGAVIVYQAGCAYALTSAAEADDRDEAFRLLRRAILDGFGADQVETDKDLRPLRRSRSRFDELAALARTARQK